MSQTAHRYNSISCSRSVVSHRWNDADLFLVPFFSDQNGLFLSHWYNLSFADPNNESPLNTEAAQLWADQKKYQEVCKQKYQEGKAQSK